MPPRSRTYKYQVVEIHDWKEDTLVKYFFTIKDVASYLKVNYETVIKWLDGKTKNYKRKNVKIFRCNKPVYVYTEIDYPNDEII